MEHPCGDDAVNLQTQCHANSVVMMLSNLRTCIQVQSIVILTMSLCSFQKLGSKKTSLPRIVDL